MPELPEVETTRRGVAPHAVGRTLTEIIVRNRQLRWPIPNELPGLARNSVLLDIRRRGKYLLFQFEPGYALLHLGMSGSLRVVPTVSEPGKHDHLDLCFGDVCLRYNDPRRFGSLLWAGTNPEKHPLLCHLGPEPLGEHFHADYLYDKTRKRTQNIKTLIMDSKIVVGVGNIYANEALFAAGIHPLKVASKTSRAQLERLIVAIKTILSYAIKRGGTTLRDFVGGDGRPGYFAQELQVYGRGGEPCRQCNKALTEKRVAQRSTVYCVACQR